MPAKALGKRGAPCAPIPTVGGFMSISARTHVARAVALAVVSSASTQQAAIAAERELDELAEVVVTAQFREQLLQDTPIAITAVNAEMLEARGQTSIADVAAQAPSVTLR